MPSVRLSAWIYLTVCILAIANGILDLPQLRYVTPILIGAFVALEIRGVAKMQRWIAIGLGATGIAIAATRGLALHTLIEAVWRVQIFAVLWFAVTWLQFPARTSPSLRDARTVALSQPSGKRHLTLSLTVHGLGGFLNLAGLSLLSSIVEGDKDPILKRRFVVALTQGFTSISGWSPVFIALPVVLVVLPDARWRELAPLGILLSATLLVSNWLFDRLIYRHHPGRSTPAQTVLAPETWLKLAVLISSLIIPVLTLVEGTDLAIPIALALVGPTHALVWWWLIVRGHPSGDLTRSLTTQVLQSLPSLRGEIVIFVGATIFGVGVSTIVTPEVAKQLVDGLELSPEMGIVLVAGIIAIFGLAGLHPVVPVFLIGEVLPPHVLHLAPWVVALTMIMIWGLTVTMSPFSGISLYMMRASGVSNYRLAYVWNLPFALIGICLMIGSIILLRHISAFI